MRTIALAAVAGMAIVVGSATAHADVTGIYDVKFEEVSSNCTSPLRYPAGKLTVKTVGTTVHVEIDRTPRMTGSIPKGEKISAKSKSGPTMVEGMMGVFSVAGKITPEGLLHVVMVGEYSANAKPLCTQTWNVIGPRTDALKKKSSSVNDGEREPAMQHLIDLARIGR
jgi:hypothetical protein